MYQTVHDAESLLDSTDEGRTALHESSGVGVQYCTLSTYYAPCHLIAFFLLALPCWLNFYAFEQALRQHAGKKHIHVP